MGLLYSQILLDENKFLAAYNPWLYYDIFWYNGFYTAIKWKNAPEIPTVGGIKKQ